MPDPKEHAEQRGVIETILRYIPGFRGYLEKEYRRESDKLQRAWLADQLQRAKGGLDAHMKQLVQAGQIDLLPQLDQLRGRIDRTIARLRGGVAGYSGWFDLVRVDEQLLDEVYSHDAAMLAQVEALADGIEQIATATGTPQEQLADLLAKLQAVDAQIDGRDDILRGLAD